VRLTNMDASTRTAPQPLEVILVANYLPDGQQSMLRFARVLDRELQRRGYRVVVASPSAILGHAGRTVGGVGKWLGYVDKFLLFPPKLRATLRAAGRRRARCVVHVCDHSNAVYTRHLRGVPHVVTCNDLLAVRSARGEFPQNPTRWSGRILQRWILSGLNAAQHIACISDATRADVLRLTSVPKEMVHRIYMGLNHPYRQVDPEVARPTVSRLLSGAAAPQGTRAFVLHVGGNQWYKNRPGVLRIYAGLKRLMGAGPLPALVMAGQPFTPSMRELVDRHGLQSDVVELTGVSDAELAALYSEAEILLYPSLAEGFGWPIAEAMACGCRVVASDRPPLTEVGGTAATFINPEDERGSAATVSDVLREDPQVRRRHVDEGFRLQPAFSTNRMVDQYVALYEAIGASA
jgi:glycosyltransferase involved in cell wall biosynthesis